MFKGGEGAEQPPHPLKKVVTIFASEIRLTLMQSEELALNTSYLNKVWKNLHYIWLTKETKKQL